MLGTLPDHEIIRLSHEEGLIAEEFAEENVKQACYELRASDVYYDLSHGSTREVVEDGNYILLKPRQLNVLVTKESIRLASDMMARILTKGQLFSIGILPVNTYADPGFDGRLGIVLFNASTSYLKIHPGEAIAKIEFSRLESAVDREYVGQHGYHTEIWPVPTHKVLTEKEIQSDSRIGSDVDEIRAAYGGEMAQILEHLKIFRRYIILGAMSYFIVMLLLLPFIASFHGSALMISVLVGIIANCVTALGLYYFSGVINRQHT